MSISKIVRGGFWLYAKNVVNNIVGFGYWFIISAVGGSRIVGLTTATLGFAWMIIGLLAFGVDIGLQRFLGESIGFGREKDVLKYFSSSLLFAISLYLPVSLALIILGLAGCSFGNISSDMLFYSGIIVGLGFLSVFDSLFISFLKTKVLFIAYSVGNIFRLVVGAGLVILGLGWIGAILGCISMSVMSLIILLAYSFNITRLRILFDLKALRDVLSAGMARWFPRMITIVGQWLGVLTVFGISGASETGHYYIAYAIASVVLIIASSMLGLMLPVLSGMSDGRKRASWRVIKISLVFMVPVAAFVEAYPWIPLGLLGEEYVSASIMLEILLLSCVPVALTSGVISLIYAYGNYMQVLGIGLAENIPRITLYYFLTKMYGGNGTALSFTIGSLTGMLAALCVAHMVKFNINFKDLVTIVGPPFLVALISSYIRLHWLIGGFLTITFSIITYTRLNVLTRSDLREVAYALAPEDIVQKVYVKFKPLMDLLFET